MPAQRLLFVDATNLSAFRWQTGHLRPEGEFAADPAGLAAFGEYIARERNSHFYMLADVADEGFQLEDVPFTRGGDRSALIRRKLAQHFYGTPYALALSLGRAKEGRRDEKLLLAALTRPAHLDPWLAALRDAEGQLAGLFSVPLVSPELTARMSVSTPRFLLISVTRAGLRQTLFDNGQIVFSRLTTLATGATEEMAATCAAESEKMYQYMAGQRLIARGSTLPTLVLVHPSQMGAFRNACADTATIHFEFIDLLALATKLGLRTPPRDSRGEALFLHLMAKRPPREQFAPEASRHHYRLGQIRFGLRTAGYTVFGACLLFTARQAFDYQIMSQRTDATIAQTQNDRQRYDAILAALPKIPIGNDALRALVSRYDNLVRKSAGPEPLYVLVSQALQQSPRIELKRLTWTLVSDKDSKDVAAAAGKPAAAVGVFAGGVSPAPTFETADIHASLPLGLTSDHRAQLAAVDDFTAQLTALQMEVQSLKMPFDAESTKSLKSASDATVQAQAPQFILRVTRRIP